MQPLRSLALAVLSRMAATARRITTGAVSDHCRGVCKTDTGPALRNTTGEFIKVSGLD